MLTVETSYNKIRSYFSKPGADFAVGKGPNGRCLYRVKRDGKIRKCAIGCLIPARDYKPVFDHDSFAVDDVLEEAFGLHRSTQVAGFLRAVQGEHDNEGLSQTPDMGKFLTKLDALYEEYRERAA